MWGRVHCGEKSESMQRVGPSQLAKHRARVRARANQLAKHRVRATDRGRARLGLGWDYSSHDVHTRSEPLARVVSERGGPQ